MVATGQEQMTQVLLSSVAMVTCCHEGSVHHPDIGAHLSGPAAGSSPSAGQGITDTHGLTYTLVHTLTDGSARRWRRLSGR